jgi:hypothetical protein
MAKPRTKARTSNASRFNQRRKGPAFLLALQDVNRRAHEHANQRSGRREMKSVRAAIASSAPMVEDFQPGVGKRMLRWIAAMALLPPCWVTAWTFLQQFSALTMEHDFWKSAEFFYFALGVVSMIGWFWSRLFQPFFLYLYVLGHELTHAVFVYLFRGKVTGFHVSTSGGYITTNKTNLVIALSPYFVPLWSVVAALAFVLLRLFFDLTRAWDLSFYGVMGLTWTFHIVWTLWMIPRDQPDLKENGTFLSLVVIFFGNLLVLVGLMCVASAAPWESFKGFGREWIRHAAVWGDVTLRVIYGVLQELRAYGKF